MKRLLPAILTFIIAFILGGVSIFYFHFWPKPLNVDILTSHADQPYAAFKVFRYQTNSSWMSLLGFQEFFSEAVLSYGDTNAPQTSTVFINEAFDGYSLDQVSDQGVIVVFEAESSSCLFNRLYVFHTSTGVWDGPLNRSCFLTAFSDLQKYVAVDPELRTLFVRSILDDSILKQIDLPAEQTNPGTTRSILSVAVSSDNKRVVLVTGPGDLGSTAVPTLFAWNIESGDFESYLLPTKVMQEDALFPNQLLTFGESSEEVIFQSGSELLRFNVK